MIFPPLSPARYARLLASIRARGLIHPIIVWRDQIIDGVHRLKACLEAGVEPIYNFLDEGEDPFEYLADINIPPPRYDPEREGSDRLPDVPMVRAGEAKGV